MPKTLLLISPPVLFGQRWWANRIANKPHLASLAGHVRDLARVHTLELDLVAGEALGGLLAAVDEAVAALGGAKEIGLVGISCWTSLHYLGAIAVARRVRELLGDVPIVVGGHHATAMPGDFDHATCDWLVRNDGEAPLRRLCSEWPARPAAMQIIEGGVFDQSNPDGIDWANYGRKGERAGALWVGTSRGCAFQCHFCVEPERGASYSRYSVEAQLDILERLVATHAPRVIAFSDPLFGANRRWLEGFLDGVERRALPLLFWCETRADIMSREILERFKRCHFMVDFGLDTASETMAARMQKAAQPRTYLERARETFEQANAIGLHHGIYIVFNFPGEAPETVRETQAWLESLAAAPGPMAGWLSCQTFFMLPGTPAWTRMATNAQLYGTEVAHPDWWRREGDHYALATAVLPSAAWRGREHELGAFQSWNQAINALWSSRYTPEVMAFRTRFYVG
ncbi:MAG: radical SAM protein [Myxococcales bacterium]|nr:radical SAM protein [Myxococcales bacterium]